MRPFILKPHINMDAIQEISCQILENYSKQFQKCLILSKMSDFLDSLTFAIAEFPISNLILIISYLCKTRLSHTCLSFFFSNLFGEIKQLQSKISIREKSIYPSLEFHK